jgi:hypothetical protein
LSRIKVFSFDKGPEEDQNVVFLPVRRGVDLDTSGLKPEPAKTRRIDAMLKISRKLGRPLTPQENKFFTGIFGPFVTDQEIEEAIGRLRNEGIEKLQKRDIKAG